MVVTNVVRSFPIYPENIVLYTLGEIDPSPEVLPEFARLLKENKPACAFVEEGLEDADATIRIF